jgi:DNA-binding MarR family transcriptional regulator
LRVSDIAARSGASLPSASRLIARLRDRSLVAVTSVDADRRASLVSLTDAGREAMRNVRSARRRMITEAIAGIEVRRGSFGEQLKVLAEGIRGYEARQLRPR